MVSSGISQSIMPVSMGDVSVNAVSKTASIDFGTFMNQSMSNAGYDSKNVSDTTASLKDGSKVKELAEADKSFANKNVVKEASETKEVNNTENVTNETDNAKEKLEAIADAVEDIKDAIKEELGITDEDFANAMALLGMSNLDLLDATKLTELVVQVTGEESAISILTDSNLMESLENLTTVIDETVNNLEEELGMSLEEITDFVVGESYTSEEVPQESLADSLIRKTPQITVEVNEMAGHVEDMPKNEEKVSKPEVLNTQPQETTDVPTTESVMSAGKEESLLFEEDSNSSDNQMTFEQSQNPFINNLAQAVESAFEVNMPNTEVDAVSIINQIVENVKANVSQEISSMEIMLNPENLGKLNLNVSVKEGIVTASITAQNEAVKQAIETQLVILKDNMNNQGLKVEAIEVTVESHAFQTSADNSNSFGEAAEGNQPKTRRPLRLDSLEELLTEDLTEEEQLVLDMMTADGNQINFTA